VIDGVVNLIDLVGKFDTILSCPPYRRCHADHPPQETVLNDDSTARDRIAHIFNTLDQTSYRTLHDDRHRRHLLQRWGWGVN
jgi:hypothetical protein